MSSGFPTASDLNAALSSLSRATAAGFERAQQAAQEFVDPLADAIVVVLDDSGIAKRSTLTSRVRDRVERNLASRHWQISEQRLPLQQPPEWDARLLFSLYSLGNVVVHQVGGPSAMIDQTHGGQR